MASILFENATLLDVEAGERRPGTAVLVENDRIAEVADRPIRTAAERIDVRGRTLMPGLIDAHVHATITTMDLGAMARRPARVSVATQPGCTQLTSLVEAKPCTRTSGSPSPSSRKAISTGPCWKRGMDDAT